MQLFLDHPVQLQLLKDQYDNGTLGPCTAQEMRYVVEPEGHVEASAVGNKVRLVGRKPGPCRMRGEATYSDDLARETNWIDIRVDPLPERPVEIPVPGPGTTIVGPVLHDPFEA